MRRGFAPPRQPHLDRRRLRRAVALGAERATVHFESHALSVVLRQQPPELGPEQRREMAPQRPFHEARVEQRRERVRELHAHGG